MAANTCLFRKQGMWKEFEKKFTGKFVQGPTAGVPALRRVLVLRLLPCVPTTISSFAPYSATAYRVPPGRHLVQQIATRLNKLYHLHHGQRCLHHGYDQQVYSYHKSREFLTTLNATAYSRLTYYTQELEFLTSVNAVSEQQLAKLLTNLPTETVLSEQAAAPAAQMSNLNMRNENNHFDEKKNADFYQPSPSPAAQPPPAYPNAPAPPVALTYATALYAYTPSDAGDLALTPNDRVAVTEYMNAEWWKGRSERTGQEGIFPRSYVRTDEKFPAAQTPQPSSYGNMPLDVSQGASGPTDPKQPGKGQEMGKKFGKKLGNAAIFGAGATIGGNIVNSIF
ncbi:hypothetical protein FH972_022453 [Carpinus fangiana]|uniref:SH3 domain-containing protein n=1 Tax=Carpinus fangiana TaxID=176857 RepID=A0A5N6KSU3_9ROSI|nr:hypothetical protein FH972_022453 [Carpinus fangiana]